MRAHYVIGLVLGLGMLAGCDKADADTSEEESSQKKKRKKKKSSDEEGPFDLDKLEEYSYGGAFDVLEGLGPSFGAAEHSEFEPSTYSRGWASREAHDVLKRAIRKKYKMKQLRADTGAWCLMFHDDKMVRRLMTNLGGPTEEFAYSKRGRLIHWYHNDRKRPAIQEWAFFHGGANLMSYESKDGNSAKRAGTPPGGIAEHILEHSWSCLSAFGASNPKPGTDVAPPPEPQTPPPEDPAAPKYEMGQAVSILWGKKWYPGKILEVGADNRYKVHYDNYTAVWDEFVSTNRLKPR